MYPYAYRPLDDDVQGIAAIPIDSNGRTRRGHAFSKLVAGGLPFAPISGVAVHIRIAHDKR